METDARILDRLMEIIRHRRIERPEGSYTSYLFDEGQDKILKKLGEEVTEVVIASKNGEKGPIVYEVADLLYHLMVLLNLHELTLGDIYGELEGRFK